jgi:hypothetical protein
VASEALARLDELEELLEFPHVPGHITRANEIALAIARAAPSGRVPALAMRALSEAHALRETPLALKPDRARLNRALRLLREALEKQESAARR